MALKPGRMGSRTEPPPIADFTNSMAARMEEALNALMVADGLPPLKMNDNSKDTRNRRRLFVAIARGIVRHFEENAGAISLTVPDGGGGAMVVHPTFDVEGKPWP